MKSVCLPYAKMCRMCGRVFNRFTFAYPLAKGYIVGSDWWRFIAATDGKVCSRCRHFVYDTPRFLAAVDEVES